MSTINKEEIQKFSNLAEEWWDVNGKFKPLHMFNPIRIEYILDEISKHFELDRKEKDLLKNGEEFIVSIRLEDGDSIHEKYLYDEIINILKRFEEEYETKWEGQFYIEDKKEDYICYAPKFKLEINN